MDQIHQSITEQIICRNPNRTDSSDMEKIAVSIVVGGHGAGCLVRSARENHFIARSLCSTSAAAELCSQTLQKKLYVTSPKKTIQVNLWVRSLYYSLNENIATTALYCISDDSEVENLLDTSQSNIGHITARSITPFLMKNHLENQYDKDIPIFLCKTKCDINNVSDKALQTLVDSRLFAQDDISKIRDTSAKTSPIESFAPVLADIIINRIQDKLYPPDNVPLTKESGCKIM